MSGGGGVTVERFYVLQRETDAKQLRAYLEPYNCSRTGNSGRRMVRNDTRTWVFTCRALTPHKSTRASGPSLAPEPVSGGRGSSNCALLSTHATRNHDLYQPTPGGGSVPVNGLSLHPSPLPSTQVPNALFHAQQVQSTQEILDFWLRSRPRCG
jgi:hypothetical protein